MARRFLLFLILLIPLCPLFPQGKAPEKLLETDRDIIYLTMVSGKVLYACRDGGKISTYWDGKKIGGFDDAYPFVLSRDEEHFAQLAVTVEKGKRQEWLLTDTGLIGPYEQLKYPMFSSDGKKFSFLFVKGGLQYVAEGKNVYGPFAEGAELDFMFDYTPEGCRLYVTVCDEEASAPKLQLFIDGKEEGSYSMLSTPFLVEAGNHCAYFAGLPDGEYAFIDGRKYGPYDEVGLINFAYGGSGFVFPYVKDDKCFIRLPQDIVGPLEGKAYYALYHEDGRTLFYIETSDQGDYIHSGNKKYGPFSGLVTGGPTYRDKGFYHVIQDSHEITLHSYGKSYGPFSEDVLMDYMFDYDFHEWRYIVIDGRSEDGQDLASLYVGGRKIASCSPLARFISWAADKKSFSYYSYVHEENREHMREYDYVCTGGKSYIGSVLKDGRMLYLKDKAVYIY